MDFIEISGEDIRNKSNEEIIEEIKQKLKKKK